uniref:Uncharacterized protein n=1 Tax=Arundo donax TaxID=35708 RepID=A0A0A9FNE4_ARUDO
MVWSSDPNISFLTAIL